MRLGFHVLVVFFLPWRGLFSGGGSAYVYAIVPRLRVSLSYLCFCVVLFFFLVLRVFSG